MKITIVLFLAFFCFRLNAETLGPDERAILLKGRDLSLKLERDPKIKLSPDDLQVFKKSVVISRRLSDERDLDRISDLSAKVQDLGLEILFAGASNDSAASKFGHVLLRFVDFSQNAPLDDFVVGFEAAIDDPKMSYMKGVMGGYSVHLSGFSMSETYTRYANVGGRALERYILPSTPEIRYQLLRLLERDIKLGFGSYKFISFNCATAMLKTLQMAGFPLEGPLPLDVNNPIWVASYLRQNMLLPLPGLKVISAVDAFAEIGNKLGTSFSGFKDVQAQASVLNIINQLSLKTLAILAFDLRETPSSIRDAAWDHVRLLSRPQDQNIFVTISGLLPAPIAFYQIHSECTSMGDSKNFFKSTFDRNDLVMTARRFSTAALHLEEAARIENVPEKPSVFVQSNGCIVRYILQTFDPVL